MIELGEPKSFSDFFGLDAIAEGTEVLVVIVNFKQRKNLIDGLNEFGIYDFFSVRPRICQ